MDTLEKKYYQKVTVIALLFVAAVVAVFYLLVKNISEPTISENNNGKVLAPYENVSSDNVEKNTVQLYAISGIKTPPRPVTEESIQKTNLPEEIASLIPPQITKLDVKVAKFESNDGYKFYYETQALVHYNHQFYLAKTENEWIIDNAAIKNSVAYIAMHKGDYEVFVEQSAIDSKNLQATVTILQK